MNEKILLVDDESKIREMLKEYMALENYDVLEAADGFAALELFKENDFSLIVLDIMMPKIDGWTVCKEIRKTSLIPIIMLSARGEEYDRLFGFELGVDDYVVKPFSPKELLARIKAVLRRNKNSISESASGKVIKYENLLLELDSHNVYINGKKITLTPKEFDLLAFLTQHPKIVFSREQLIKQIWGYDFTGDTRTVDTHIKMLRESLQEYRKYIHTVWGIGYKFEAGS